MIPSNSAAGRPFTTDMRRLILLPLIALAAAAPPAVAGPLDTRYGNGGVASTRLISAGTALARDRGGRILVAGGSLRRGVLRLTASGRHDTRFGQRGGFARLRGPQADATPFAVRRGRDGTIRVATVLDPFGGGAPMAILRLGRRGSPLAPRVHRRSLGGLLVDGVARRDGGAFLLSSEGRLRAVAPNGALDRTFAGGTVTLPDAGPDAYFRPVLAAARGGGAIAAIPADDAPVLVRYTRDGRLDPGFGDGGRQTVPFLPQALRVLRNGDVLGAAGGGGRMARLFRLTRTGTARRGFGTRGVARGRAAREGSVVSDVVEDRRGRLYVLAHLPGRLNSGVAAFGRTGLRLRAFGPLGARYLPAPDPNFHHLGNRLLLDGRRGLLVTGQRAEYICSDRPDFECGPAEETLAVWRFRL